MITQEKTATKIEDMYPLSPMQEGLLFHTLLSPTAGTYIPQVVLSFEGSHINADRLKQSWEAAFIRHSILRTGFYWEQRDQPFQVVYRSSPLNRLARPNSETAWTETAWIEQDWQTLSKAEQTAKLQVLLACNRSEPFNLNQPPLMRLTWISCGNGRYHLIWCYHHLILDGWSASQLLKEVFQTYFVLAGDLKSFNRESPNRTPSTQPPTAKYSQYIAWLNQRDTATAQDFWKTYFKDWSDPTTLPILNHQHPDNQHSNTQTAKTQSAKNQKSTAQLSELQRPLSAKASQQIRAFVQSQKITLNTLIQAALGLLLSRYCNSHDVVFGATSAGRPTDLPGALSMVGLFINTLPVRVRVKPHESIEDWLQRLSQQQASATDYDYVSLRSIQADVNNGQRLFDCLLVFESYPVSAEMFSGQTDFQLTNIQFEEWTHFPLTILVSGLGAGLDSEGEQLTFTAKYHEENLSAEAVNRFLGHLNNLITAIIKQPQHQLQDLSLLCSIERKQLTDWNRTAVETYPLDQSVPDLFEAQVEKTPEAIALIFTDNIATDQTLTYQALNEQANQLAHQLQSIGIGPEKRVAVYLERSLDMVIALLAIVKAGAAYVPLDPSYPKERLTYMFEDADLSAVISATSADACFQSCVQSYLQTEKGKNSSTELPWISLDAFWQSNIWQSNSEADQQDQTLPSHNPQRQLEPDSSVYVIYTSGSTGKPKGVINTHQGLVNRLSWMQQTYEIAPGQKVLHKTPLSFDVSAWEIFWPLLNGATLVIAKPNGHKDSAYLTNLIQSQGIAVLHFVPSMLAAFLEAPDSSNCTTLEHVICSGEALSCGLQEHLFQQLPNNTALHNLYGPTEAAIDVTAWQCQPGESVVPIGHPIANTQIHLLDQDFNPVPIGVPGELYIGGVGVAKGYLNRPALTAERFIPNVVFSKTTQAPKSASKTVLYKTGDLARYRADGAIEYLGRQDNQIKLRGVRIETGEIEQAICEHSAIRQAVVVAQEVTEGEVTGDRTLVAYVVQESEVQESEVQDSAVKDSAVKAQKTQQLTDLSLELSTFIRVKLPEVMVPTAFISLTELPLTPNGKLDRRALPQLEQIGLERLSAQHQVAPRNETEKAIAAIWSAILHLESVSIYDNFFDLGGHSLSATRANTRMRKQFDLALPLQSLFEHPTLMDLATHIDALKISSAAPSAPPTGYKEIEL
ncbi:MAG: amino acid adenylation domain-containing protein [Cyanobacteria bacterium J06621_11]